MNTTLLLGLLACIFLGVAVYLLLVGTVVARPSVRRGLEGLSVEMVTTPHSSAPVTRREALERATRTWRRFDVYRGVELALDQAGWRLLPAELALAVGAIALLVGVAASSLLREALWGVVAAAVIVLAVPLVLSVAKARRMQKFEASLPDALELMAASLRAGHGFQRALQVTAEDMPHPVCDEFRRAVQDINIGASVEEALTGIMMRVPSYEMELLTTAVTIQLQVGGNLSEILAKIAETLRERARIRGEIATLTAEGKLSAIVVFAMPILLFVFLLTRDPEYMKPLVAEDFGKIILGAAALAEIVGMGIIWKMVSVEV